MSLLLYHYYYYYIINITIVIVIVVIYHCHHYYYYYCCYPSFIIIDNDWFLWLLLLLSDPHVVAISNGRMMFRCSYASPWGTLWSNFCGLRHPLARLPPRGFNSASRWPKSFGDGHIPASEAHCAAIYGQDLNKHKKRTRVNRLPICSLSPHLNPSSYKSSYHHKADIEQPSKTFTDMWILLSKPWYLPMSIPPNGRYQGTLEATVLHGLLQQFPGDAQPCHAPGSQHQFLCRSEGVRTRPRAPSAVEFHVAVETSSDCSLISFQRKTCIWIVQWNWLSKTNYLSKMDHLARFEGHKHFGEHTISGTWIGATKQHHILLARLLGEAVFESHLSYEKKPTVSFPVPVSRRCF